MTNKGILDILNDDGANNNEEQNEPQNEAEEEEEAEGPQGLHAP